MLTKNGETGFHTLEFHALPNGKIAHVLIWNKGELQ